MSGDVNVGEEGGMSDVNDTFASAIDFDTIVNPANWQSPAEYYQLMPSAARAVVNHVVSEDDHLKQELRETYFPALLRAGTLHCWEKANQNYIEALQRKVLYPGRVVAADATLAKYETLSLVGAQIAVSTVSYQGATGQFVSNIMHWGKELPRKTTAAEIVQALRSRGQDLKDKLPNVFLYALTLYKERQVLMASSPGTFKLIQGTIFPFEMLSGSGKQHTLQTCLGLIGDLIDDGSYAAIVSHASQREVLALGLGLNAGEYIVVKTGVDLLEAFERTANYVATPIEQYGYKSQKELFKAFKDKYGPKVVQGVLKAHPMSPPYVFYCNLDRLEEAVHMLLADAANTGPRGFPLLVDLADQYCSGAFKASEYTSYMNAEFARASGGSGAYQSERTTRD